MIPTFRTNDSLDQFRLSDRRRSRREQDALSHTLGVSVTTRPRSYGLRIERPRITPSAKHDTASRRGDYKTADNKEHAQRPFHAARGRSHRRKPGSPEGGQPH